MNTKGDTVIKTILAFSLIVFLSACGGGTSPENEKYVGSNQNYTPYVDVTLFPLFDFNTSLEEGIKSYTMAFVNSPKDEYKCRPVWHDYSKYSIENSELDLVNKIEMLQENGGDVTISFGGAAAKDNELATVCSDANTLLSAYQEVLDKTKVKIFDFDIEGENISKSDNIDKRVLAIKKLQENNSELEISFTLSSNPESGLSADGVSLIEKVKKAGIKIRSINLMLMDFGEAYPAKLHGGLKMAEYSILALKEANKQLHTIYDKNSTQSSVNGEYYHLLGAVAMIGQNDILSEVFYLEDVKKLYDFCKKEGVYITSIWSLNRDKAITRGESKTTELEKSSKLSSGVYGSNDFAFSKILNLK